LAPLPIVSLSCLPTRNSRLSKPAVQQPARRVVKAPPAMTAQFL